MGSMWLCMLFKVGAKGLGQSVSFDVFQCNIDHCVKDRQHAI